MKTALVHDWLTGMRGGEKVLEVLCELLPGSDLYTLIYLPGRLTPRIENRRVFTSWLNRLPNVGRYYRYLLPLMPAAAGMLKLRGYDLVVAVSHCVAHGVRVAGSTRFVCYCLTPMRYAWASLGSYFAGRRRRDVRYRLLRLLSGEFRHWDRSAAGRVAEYVTISRTVQERVKSCYGRESTVIHPPVDTDYYRPVPGPGGDFYLWTGALAPYKRIDLALEAFARLGSRLVVIGEGQDLSWARRVAPPNVRFLGRQPDRVLRRHYASCRALVFPGEEDFGIVPLEAQACGRPVIAYGRGGVLDTVVPLDENAPGRAATGLFFSEQSPESLMDAVRRFEQLHDRFDGDAIRAHALEFSRDRCKAALGRYLLGKREDGS
jgi:glycosyltransferase involved in cell wall biosynthesis